MSAETERLAGIIARLRAPGGCPWDREQTAASLIPSLLEEAHEVADAVERGDDGDLREELGDLLINILMQAEIASERKAFTLEAVASAASEKLVRRHPHVFGDSTAGTSEAVLTQWEEIKRAERRAKGAAELPGSLLDGVPLAFPSPVRAQKIQKKAAKAGFDWERPGDVVDKIREELAEVEHELNAADRPGAAERLRDEIGDLLFTVVNLSRALSIDAESALRAATGKFEKRFRAMERAVPEGRAFAELSPAEMNALWEQAKTSEKSA
jgi:MazG family protein